MTDTQLVPYDLETAVIEELKAKYSDISIPPDDKDAYAMVMAGLRECREIRLACDEWHKGKKAYILKAGKHYDGEKRRVHALVEPIENGLKEARQVEDDRLEAIKAADTKRREDIRAKIAYIGQWAVIPNGYSCADLKKRIDGVNSIYITAEEYQDFEMEAINMCISVNETLKAAYKDREKWEQEQATAKVEAKRLENIRKEQAAEAARLQAIADELANAQKAVADAQAKIEAEKKAADEAINREAFEKQVKENARIQAEKDAIENARQKAEEAEALAAVEAEKKARKEALRPDKEKLLAWADLITTDPGPDVKDPKAQKIVETYVYKLFDLAYCLRLDAEEL